MSTLVWFEYEVPKCKTEHELLQERIESALDPAQTRYGRGGRACAVLTWEEIKAADWVVRQLANRNVQVSNVLTEHEQEGLRRRPRAADLMQLRAALLDLSIDVHTMMREKPEVFVVEMWEDGMHGGELRTLCGVFREHKDAHDEVTRLIKLSGVKGVEYRGFRADDIETWSWSGSDGRLAIQIKRSLVR